MNLKRYANSFLHIRLSVKRRGKWHVIQSTGSGTRSFVSAHSLNTIFCLIWWQFSSQFIGQDIWLRKTKNCIKNSNVWNLEKNKWVIFFTLSPARILKESITCSAVSTSVDSRVMKSKKASNVTVPELLGSTTAIILWKSISPCNKICHKIVEIRC